jgi:hypothetical protein
MTQRSIGLSEIIETVKEGQLGKATTVQDFLTGCFFHRGLFVIVGAPFGDFSAKPNIVTVFRDGEDYTPDIANLYATKVVEKVVEKVVGKKLEDFTLEELEAMVKAKRDDVVGKLKARRDVVLLELLKLEKLAKPLKVELVELDTKLGQKPKVEKVKKPRRKWSRNTRSRNVSDFEAAITYGTENNIRTPNGRHAHRLNGKTLSAMFNLHYREFIAYCKKKDV